MRKLLYILFLVTTLALLATACGNDNADDKNKDKIKINTTVYSLQSFAEQIGGKHVSVKSIYPPGMDLHDFEPTQKDIINTNKLGFQESSCFFKGIFSPADFLFVDG